MKAFNINGFYVLRSDEMMSWDSASALPALLNQQSSGGFSDWCLPDRDTLIALAAHDLQSQLTGDYWSACGNSTEQDYAFYVDFGSGRANSNDKNNLYYVLVMRRDDKSALNGE